MPSTSADAHLLATRFLSLAQSIGDFRYNHWDELSPDQHAQLAKDHWSALNQGENMLALSTSLIGEELAKSLTELMSITDKAKTFLATVADIKKGLAIMAAILSLGAAVLSKDPVAIEKSIESIAGKV